MRKRHTPVAQRPVRPEGVAHTRAVHTEQCLLPGAGKGRQKALPEKGGREKTFSLWLGQGAAILHNMLI